MSHTKLPFSTSAANNRGGDDPRPQPEARSVTKFTAKRIRKWDYGHYHEAQMELLGRDEFVVLAGSKIRLNESPHLSRVFSKIAERRRKLNKDEKEGVLVLAKDEIFYSISATARFVLGRSDRWGEGRSLMNF